MSDTEKRLAAIFEDPYKAPEVKAAEGWNVVGELVNEQLAAAKDRVRGAIVEQIQASRVPNDDEPFINPEEFLRAVARACDIDLGLVPIRAAWTGEMATVSNGGLPAPKCNVCQQRHPADAACKAHRKARKVLVYDEPAHEVPTGTCKGCDAPEAAPPEKHRFSCTVHGKRQAKAGADRGASDTSCKVKR